MLGNHLEIANFLIQKLEHAVSYPLACSLTINELTMSEQEIQIYLKSP